MLFLIDEQTIGFFFGGGGGRKISPYKMHVWVRIAFSKLNKLTCMITI